MDDPPVDKPRQEDRWLGSSPLSIAPSSIHSPSPNSYWSYRSVFYVASDNYIPLQLWNHTNTNRWGTRYSNMLLMPTIKFLRLQLNKSQWSISYAHTEYLTHCSQDEFTTTSCSNLQMSAYTMSAALQYTSIANPPVSCNIEVKGTFRNVPIMTALPRSL